MKLVELRADIVGIPHSFLFVRDTETGFEAGYGHAPLETGLSGPGQISDDTIHPYQATLYYAEITDQQYIDLMRNIEIAKNTPPFYDLPVGQQCTVWALEQLTNANIPVSSIPPSPEGLSKTVAYNPYIQFIEAIFNAYVDTAQQAENTLDNFSQKLSEISNEFIDHVQMTHEALSGLANKIYEQSAGANKVLPNSIFDFLSKMLRNIGESVLDFFFTPAYGADVNPLTANQFNAAQAFVPRRDPLVLDLDGDGIETTGIGNVYFDHDADGVKTASGWVKSDDGLLVMDRNGNGTIDTGRELFGDGTLLANGKTAADGFAALAQEDSNADGRIDASDARFADLRVWRDLNQDGVSQSGELFTLADLGIESIALSHSTSNQALGNGNRLLGQADVNVNDGATGKIAEIDLADDTFRSQFSDPVPLAEGASALPNLAGAGKVRELRQAASLSAAVNALLTQYSQAATRTEQLALLDHLLSSWADTAGMANSMDDRDPAHFRVRYDSFGNVSRGSHLLPAAAVTANDGTLSPDGANDAFVDADYKALIASWNRKIHVLEAFNGRYFFNLPGQNQPGSSAILGLSTNYSYQLPINSVANDANWRKAA